MSLFVRNLRPTVLVATLLVFANLVSGCSTPKRRVEIRSTPPGAEIQTLRGEVIGKTPLVLEEKDLSKHLERDRLLFLLVHPNYIQRQIQLNVHGEDIVEVQLSKL